MCLIAASAGTLSEAKQLSALQALLSLTSGPEAGFLGSSWVIILRAISALDALKVWGTQPTQPASCHALSSLLVHGCAHCLTSVPSEASNSSGHPADPWLSAGRCSLLLCACSKS